MDVMKGIPGGKPEDDVFPWGKGGLLEHGQVRFESLVTQKAEFVYPFIKHLLLSEGFVETVWGMYFGCKRVGDPVIEVLEFRIREDDIAHAHQASALGIAAKQTGNDIGPEAVDGRGNIKLPLEKLPQGKPVLPASAGGNLMGDPLVTFQKLPHDIAVSSNHMHLMSTVKKFTDRIFPEVDVAGMVGFDQDAHVRAVFANGGIRLPFMDLLRSQPSSYSELPQFLGPGFDCGDT
jgi:hypothetical protein